MSTLMQQPETNTCMEQSIRDRYARGAAEVEPGLCCPTAEYDPQYLAILPQEILEKDYGCGDPSAHAREGDVVLDLGSGAGKVCYILAQKVGPGGQVIGLDFNDAMLNLARRYQDEMVREIGYDNVHFHKARIQDMALDLDRAAAFLAAQPIASIEQMDAYQNHCAYLRDSQPLIADQSVDLIVSNCVLNLVSEQEKAQLFREMHRVLKPGGRTVISDIVCDEEPTPAMRADPHLWSGCLSGAFREHRFLEMFADSGFYGMEILKRQDAPWQTIDGIEFRAMTVRAYKGKDGPCLERHQAVIYTGPWSRVHDDDNHVLYRGQRMAVCDKTYQIMIDPHGPYAGQIIGIEPCEPVNLEDAPAFVCRSSERRDPQQTKGASHRGSHTAAGEMCEPGSGCC